MDNLKQVLRELSADDLGSLKYQLNVFIDGLFTHDVLPVHGSFNFSVLHIMAVRGSVRTAMWEALEEDAER